MKINPDPPDLQRPIDPSTTPAKTGTVFAATLTSKSQVQTDASQNIDKQTLTDPTKAGTAIDQAIQQLMDKEFAGLCAADLEQVAGWLRRDPLVRDALLKRMTSSGS